MKPFNLAIFFFLSMCIEVYACQSPPISIIDLDVNKFYKDKQHSIIDSDLKAKHDAAVKPLERFMNEIASLGDQFLQDSKKNIEQCQCANLWLYSWANSDGLLGEMKTEQSFYERKWMLAGMSLVYAKVQKVATHKQRTTIEKWLSKLADQTIKHSDAYLGSRNNHYYWEGAAIAVAGKITKNQKFLDWAQKVFDAGMKDIADEGSLPLEIARGQRALHYHLFSAAPLVVLSSVLDRPSARLKLLVEFIMQSTQDPNNIAKMAGALQDKEADRDYAWLEFYLRKNPDVEIEKFLIPRRPLRYSK